MGPRRKAPFEFHLLVPGQDGEQSVLDDFLGIIAIPYVALRKQTKPCFVKPPSRR